MSELLAPPSPATLIPLLFFLPLPPLLPCLLNVPPNVLCMLWKSCWRVLVFTRKFQAKFSLRHAQRLVVCHAYSTLGGAENNFLASACN